MKLISIYFASDMEKVDQGERHNEHTQDGQADADDGGIVDGGGGSGADVLEVEFAKEQAEASDDEAKGDGGKAGTNPGQEGAFVGKMIGDIFASWVSGILGWWI